MATSLPEAINVTGRLKAVTDGGSGRSPSPSESGMSLDIQVANLDELIAHSDGKTSYGDGVDYAYATGFDVLVDELAGGQVSGSSLFLNLEDIFQLISDDISYEQFWAETESHLKQYREFRLAPPVQPLASVQTHSDFLAFLIAKAFDFSCPELMGHARAAATLVAHQATNAALTERLLEFLQQQPAGSREAAALMDRLRDAPHLRETLSKRAQIDATNDDFVVATLARRVLVDLNFPFKKPAPKSLPPFYDLVTLESEQDDNYDPPPGLVTGQRSVWSDDPWTWTSSLRRAFRILTKGCYVPKGLLRRRCASFMAKEGGQEAFGPEVEDAILAKLRRMNLQFSFRRPMPMAALRAFGKMLQELDAAEEVDPRMFPTIWADIGGPALFGIPPERDSRPSWAAFPPIPVRQHGGIDLDEWLQRADDELFTALFPDYFLLAEHKYSRIKALRSSASSTKLVLPSAANLAEGLDGLPNMLSIDIQTPTYQEADSELVCQLQPDLYGDLRGSAITICPYVTRSLGWIRSVESPFSFTDSNGQVVARSHFWIDGTNADGGYYAELFGAGQALLLSLSGKAQLESKYGPLSIGARVERKIADDSGRTDRSLLVASFL